MTKPSTKKLPQRPIVPEDLLRFLIVSDPQIAPDGRQIVFVEKHVGSQNNSVSNLWIVAVEPAAGPVPARREGASPRSLNVPRQFTAGGSDCHPRWSPDGTQIAFLREAKDVSPQIYAIGIAGGEARRLTNFPEGQIGEFGWSPDGNSLAVQFRPQDPERTKAANTQRQQQGLSDPPWVTDDLFYRLDGEGYFGSQRHRLYIVDLRGEELPARELYGQDTLGMFTFDFSPDSRQLVIATNRHKEPSLHPEADELLRIDVATGKITRIPRLPLGPKTSPRWSPDGQTIAYAGRLGNDTLYSTENLELFVCHPLRGDPRSLTRQHDYCLEAQSLSDIAVGCGNPTLHFSPDSSRIYFRLSDRGESHVASVAMADGVLAFHTHGPLDVRMGNLSLDGRRMALTVGNTTTLAEVAVLDMTATPGAAAKGIPSPSLPAMLSNFNGPLLAQLQLCAPEPHWIEAADGHQVQLWVIKPAARKKKMPAVLEIHGGPHAQYASSFFFEFQLLAAQGYAVFYSNPRGSKGYGREHCAAIRGCWGTTDWIDLQAVIRFMKDQPFVDTQRMGVMGGSYGGYMTNWAIGHCHDFAAAVSDRSISNLVSWSGSTDVIEPTSDYFPGNFWDQPEVRWDQSPLKYLGNAKAPTLIIHSAGDLRCNIEQAEQLFAALKLLGVPARLVRYPSNTSHGMSRGGPPDLRIHRLQQILAWWRQYLDAASGDNVE
ncbi:MAG: S9 family peptidase [Planctomycetota bacterium]